MHVMHAKNIIYLNIRLSVMKMYPNCQFGPAEWITKDGAQNDLLNNLQKNIIESVFQKQMYYFKYDDLVMYLLVIY